MPALSRAVGLAALVGLALLAAGPAGAQEPARRADEFVDHVGVATHWGYPDTPYGYAYERVEALLAAAGIRHVRDGFHPRLLDLYRDHGIRATCIASPADLPQTLRAVRQYLPCLAMVEGPNEVDIFPQSAAYQGQGFPGGPRRWMQALYGALRADALTARVPLIAPSIARADSNGRLAPLTCFDYCVMHSYAGGQMPSRSLIADINNNLTVAWSVLGHGADLKPIVVTESGYHTALGSSVVIGGAQPGVSERAQAKYLLRHFAEYFNAGMVRTFTYEFIDEFADYESDERQATNAEACFGIVKRDLKPKPAYTALANLIGLLSEARWDPATRRWERPAPGFRPRALALRMSGDIRDVHHALLQKANGDYFLLLWREVPSFDLARREDIQSPAVPVRLLLGAPIEQAVLYRPLGSTRGTFLTPGKQSVTSLTVAVPDEVVVVRLRPARLPLSGAAPEPPRAARAVTTATTARLAWRGPPGAKPACYFVWRMGAYAGRTTVASFEDRGLLPGAGYRYAIAACDSAGRVSRATPIVARTRSEFPDLVVRDVAFVAPPVAGEPVRLRATIANQGTASTPAGVVHGVAFEIDGAVVCWSDTFTGPLRPGASRVVESSNGPRGIALWTPTRGPHTIRAVVDDVRRIAESTRANNTRERAFAVP